MNEPRERRRVYLMRHGEVAYYADPDHPVSPADVVLTPTGVDQARAAGRALAGVEFDRVITSGMPRTDETAALVLSQLDRSPRIATPEAWHELREITPGDVSLIAEQDIEDAFLRPFRGRPPMHAEYLGGESVGSLMARTAEGLQRLYADPDWHTVLLVLHGGVNRAILSQVISGTDTFYGLLEQSYACINVIDGDPGNIILRTVNYRPTDAVHLDSRHSTVELIMEQYRAFRSVGR